MTDRSVSVNTVGKGPSYQIVGSQPRAATGPPSQSRMFGKEIAPPRTGFDFSAARAKTPQLRSARGLKRLRSVDVEKGAVAFDRNFRHSFAVFLD